MCPEEVMHTFNDNFMRACQQQNILFFVRTNISIMPNGGECLNIITAIKEIGVHDGKVIE